jgi:SAM-dependent methyltransferase
MNAWMTLVRRLHAGLVFGRRTQTIAQFFTPHVPQGATVLDVGCGDGTIASLLLQHDPTLSIQGLEIAARPACSIECRLFDGKRIPHPDRSFDVCLFVDVLHHAEDMEFLLKEARRVSRRFLLIKDHCCENRFDWWTLKVMDWVGNRPHGVVLTYDYKSRKQWIETFASCGLRPVTWQESLPLYSFPVRYIFGRKLHFVALLEKLPSD